MGHNKIQKFQLLGCVNFCICHYFHEKSTILKLVLTYDFYSLFWYLVWILALKWLDSKSLVLWPSESPSYDYMHWKFLIFIQSTYFSHLMITSGGAVQFAKTVVTLMCVNFMCPLLDRIHGWPFDNRRSLTPRPRPAHGAMSVCWWPWASTSSILTVGASLWFLHDRYT